MGRHQDASGKVDAFQREFSAAEADGRRSRLVEEAGDRSRQEKEEGAACYTRVIIVSGSMCLLCVPVCGVCGGVHMCVLGVCGMILDTRKKRMSASSTERVPCQVHRHR